MSINQSNFDGPSPNSSIGQCSICMENLVDQEIGMPEHCQHSFCFTCIRDWAKRNNSCPNDRQQFQYILKKYSFSSRRPYAKVNIADDQLEPYLEEDPILCDTCGEDDQEYPLLTCTGCNNGYHTFCLNSFDPSSWMCPECGYNHEERAQVQMETTNTSTTIRQAKAPLKDFSLRDQPRTLHSVKPLRRLQQQINPRKPPMWIAEKCKKTSTVRPVITPTEAARRIAASGVPILTPYRSSVLISQRQNMTELKRKRKRFARLPLRIPLNQLPRIQHRPDAPVRPRSTAKTEKSNLSANASFIDQLLHSQKNLHLLQNVRMQGAQIKLS